MLDWFKSRTTPSGASSPTAVTADSPETPPDNPAAPPVETTSWRDRLRAGLAKTRHAVGLTKLFAKLDESALEELETAFDELLAARVRGRQVVDFSLR